MDINDLIGQITDTDNFFKGFVVKSIDRFMTIRNWLIGFYLFEYEQKGADRAAYGAQIEKKVAQRINKQGLSERNLKLFKQFYSTYYPITQTVSAQLEKMDSNFMQTVSASNHQTVSDDFIGIDPELLINQLSFSHFVELMKLKDPLKRSYYEVECIKGTWSVRELKRQINTLAFERSASAKSPKDLAKSLQRNTSNLKISEIIKTPYIFDFLGLPDHVLASESELEHALISNLKEFMLELGHGFCFEAQQKRIVIGGEYFFIDLVFYHRILKCHVLIELKIDAFNHQYVGQLNFYLQYYKKNIKTNSDNSPIGILLCTNKNQELVEFALGGMDQNLFVSQYLVELPSTEQLKQFLRNEKENLQ
jgi:predicted nuclease of restriction endonuclease-like (RecB) superfamily